MTLVWALVFLFLFDFVFVFVFVVFLLLFTSCFLCGFLFFYKKKTGVFCVGVFGVGVFDFVFVFYVRKKHHKA